MSDKMKLCISLDLEGNKENLELVQMVKDCDVWLKVGFRSFLRDGRGFLENIKSINPNFKIFLDLKLYDIPNTMADAAYEIAKFGIVDMFNVHSSSGILAMKTVMQRLEEFKNRPLVLAVTALTSFDNDSFKKIYNDDISKKANEFAKSSFEAGLDGVVCSAFESLDIKSHTSKDFITLCPGIRPFGEDSGDQKRVANIDFAKKNLVDYIVVGRPIYKSENPKAIVEKILNNI